MCLCIKSTKIFRYVFALSFGIYLLSFSFINPSHAQDDAIDFIAMYAGETPKEGNLEGLRAYLLEHPELIEDLSRRGSVRIVINSKNGSTQEQLERKKMLQEKIQSIFEEVGVNFKKRGIRRFLFNPINVSFIPVDLEAKYEEAQAEVKEAFSSEDSDKIDKMFSEFSCTDTDECVTDSFKKLLASNEVMDNNFKELSESKPPYSYQQMNDMANDIVKTFLKQFNPEDRIKVLQILSINFSKSISEIVETFELQNLEGIDLDIISKIEEKTTSDSNATNPTAGININPNDIKVKKSIFSTIFDTVTYLPVTLLKSLRVPIKDLSLDEIVQGLAPKVLPFIWTVGWYNYVYADVPWAWWMAFSLSLSLDTFHGAEASGWIDFQSRMKQDKGERFQTVFNTVYGWFWALCFRSIGYAAGTIPQFLGLFSGFFNLTWASYIYVTGIIGSRVASRGFNALNELHYKLGRINKRTRDILQQWVRDFFFIVCGAMLGTGGETNPITYLMFGLGLMFDQSLWVIAQTVEQAPILIISEDEIVKSEELAGFYPHLKVKDQVIPVRSMSLGQALKHCFFHILEFPVLLVAPVVKIGSSCVSKFTRKASTQE